MDAIADYLSGKSVKYILTTHHICSRSLYQILRSNGVPLRGRVDYGGKSDYFYDLQTPEQWYWFGFLCADGCVRYQTRGNGSSGNWVMQCHLSAIDIDHLQKFASVLDYRGPITTERRYDKRYKKYYSRVTLRWANQDFSKSLIQRGINQIKAGDISSLIKLSDAQIRQFLLGFFDGDGALYRVGTGRKNWRWYICSPFQSLLEYIMSRCPVVNRCNAIRTRKHKPIWKVQYNGNLIVHRLCQWLYQDGIYCLPRKRHQYNQLTEFLSSANQLQHVII